MNTFSNADIFFFISSVGFVFLWILVGILLIYLIRITRTFSRIMDRLEGDINKLSDATKEVILEIRESSFFNFLFGKKKRRKNTKEE